MDYLAYNQDLFSFLKKSPTAFHAVREIRQRLANAGFIELYEQDNWPPLEPGKLYFVCRNSSALLAFSLACVTPEVEGLRFLACHCDSPGLQIKANPAINNLPLQQLGVEVYGGPLLHPWFDRDLSVAGRVCFSDSQHNIYQCLIDFNRPILTIPSLAIHFDREANKLKAVDAQKHLPPIFSQLTGNKVKTWPEILKEQLTQQYCSVEIEKILSFDLFCYEWQEATFNGYAQEFITASRLDNLLSCHAATVALSTASTKGPFFFICANHEEIGSLSATGAQGNLVGSVLSRLIPENEQRYRCLSQSFLLSLDNAHATHPNYCDSSDPNHRVSLNSGPVIKINANQRYATDSLTAAIIKLLASQANIPVQEFIMRSDLPCGSTIGPALASKLGVATADVGAPTLAMHSIREMTGSNDPAMLAQLISHYLSASLLQFQVNLCD